MQSFPIGTRWVIYEDEVPHVHMVIEYKFEASILITECNGKYYEWVPSILEWMAEPA